MWLGCIDPRISRNLPKFPEIFQPFWNLPFSLETFHFIQESSRLSGNSPDWLEIFKAVRKSSRLSRNLLDFSEIFQTIQDIFQTVMKSFTLFGNSQDYPEHFPLYWNELKCSRLSGNHPDYLEIFQIVWKNIRTVLNISGQSERFYPEIF